MTSWYRPPLTVIWRCAPRPAATRRTAPLMDCATIGAKALKQRGILKNLDESEEINACTVKIKCDVDGEQQDWLFLFNERDP